MNKSPLSNDEFNYSYYENINSKRGAVVIESTTSTGEPNVFFFHSARVYTIEWNISFEVFDQRVLKFKIKNS